MNHSQTYSTEQVGQVPETTLHPLNSSQSDTLQVKSTILVKYTLLPQYT